MKKLQHQLHKIGKKALLHVVPHEDNNHIPHLMRGASLVGFTVIALIAFAAVTWGIPLSREHGLTAEVYSSVLVDLTNDARGDNAIHPLVVNKTLEQVAMLKAQDMAAKGYFAHTSPEGRSPWYWFDQAGYKFIFAGENLAVNFDETKDVENALLASPTHRANILDKNFTEIGIATYPGEYKGMRTTFVVESFGTPQKKAVVVAPKPAETAAAPVAVATTPTRPVQSEVLGETAPEQKTAPVKKLVVKPTPVKVLQETPQLAIAQNVTEPEIAVAAEAPVEQVKPVSRWYERFLMNPGPATRNFILALALLIALATVAMLAHEIARKHTKHIAYGASFVLFALALAGIGQVYLFPHLAILK